MNAITKRPDTSSSNAMSLPKLRVGKDVLELLSTAMYVEPLMLYREYLQNAADAIDLARSRGLLAGDAPGVVTLAFDTAPRVRSVTIRDNGTGLGHADFAETLLAIGGSQKRGGGMRGFRGVGRLAGLAYARTVTFRSRVEGETAVSQLTWDCVALRAALRNPVAETLDAVMPSVVRLETKPAAEHPERFFEVELAGVIRQGSDRLMDPEAVRDYLAQVAPVPFAPGFSHSAKIAEALGPYGALGSLQLFIEGLGQVFRPHRDVLTLEDGRTIRFDQLVVTPLSDTDEGVAAMAWVLHHDYEGALPNASLVKGLRIRAGDMQVGEHSLFEDLFAEARFNAWTVGEVHIFDPRIRPNGRRDHFEADGQFANLRLQLGPIAKDISQRCRTNSIRRNWAKTANTHYQVALEKVEILEQRAVVGGQREALIEEVEDQLTRLRRLASSKSAQSDDAEVANVRADALSLRLTQLGGHDSRSPLERLPAEARVQYEKLFELVYQCSANRIAAKALVDRMIEKVVSGYRATRMS